MVCQSKWSAWYGGWAVTKSFPGHRGRPGQRGGSLARDTQAGGRVEPGLLSAAAEGKVSGGIEACAAHTAKTGNEAAIGYKLDGTQVGNLTNGKPMSCDISEIVGGKAEILIHSHPNTASFSSSDFGVLSDHPNIKHMIVVTSDGSIYRLSRTKETQELSSRRWFAREYQMKGGEILYPLKVKVSKGEMTEPELWATYTHQMNQYLAESQQLEYVKVIP